jgi:quercetin dioxygenase-like cupin family protein
MLRVSGPARDRAAFITHPDDGETITDREGRELAVLAADEGLTVTRYRLGHAEQGPDPHVHHQHTDAFYVLAGELEFTLGPARERIRVAAGGFVAAPPNLVHTFANESDAEARALNLHAPDAGFASYLRAARDGERGITFDTSEPPEDGGRPLADAVVSGPGEGERLVSGNRAAVIKGALPDLCFAEFELEGRYVGPDPHDHESEVDAFYVLDGELEITIEGSPEIAGPGALAVVPPGIRHTFAHNGAGTARFLNLHAPDGGFGEFLRRVSD